MCRAPGHVEFAIPGLAPYSINADGLGPSPGHQKTIADEAGDLNGVIVSIRDDRAEPVYQQEEILVKSFQLGWVTAALGIGDDQGMEAESLMKQAAFVPGFLIVKIRPYPQVRIFCPLGDQTCIAPPGLARFAVVQQGFDHIVTPPYVTGWLQIRRAPAFNILKTSSHPLN